ncbi:hypothetical protein GDO81_000774 [Engystomops pustulosus]|uniref:Membrane insertase YidC/Oxa/ALB C-terminal domain-containing protein n=1 Tax=Engystomops pustulosus TaxID=76066 RepID=A0AAV7D8I8_ENGPU|nr:hypothetical protein GDO81_000774 [Engystomops pustulosus]
MFFKNLKIVRVGTRTSEHCTSKIWLLKRCQNARSFGITNFQKHQQGLNNPVQTLHSSHRYHTGKCKSPLLISCVPNFPKHRTFASAASLSAASMGQVNTDYGIFAKMADSAPVHLAEKVLMSIQEVTGLPWWLNIMCTTIALRTAVTLPLSVYQMHVLGKVEKLQPEIQNLAKELRYEVAVYGKQHGWSDKVAKFHFHKNMKRLISELYVRDNCHPFKASLIMWIQIPMWIFVSLALRNFSYNTSGSSTGNLHMPLCLIMTIRQYMHLCVVGLLIMNTLYVSRTQTFCRITVPIDIYGIRSLCGKHTPSHRSVTMHEKIWRLRCPIFCNITAPSDILSIEREGVKSPHSSTLLHPFIWMSP